MKVILRSDVTNIGKQGDIKNVSPGYARNFLLPRKLAMEANASNMKIWEREKVRLEKEREEIIGKAKDLAGQIEKISVTIPMKLGESGKLFGSVGNSHIAKALDENGFKVAKQDILLAEPLKEIGAFTVEIRLHPEVNANLKVWIIEDKSEKE
ncbi:MAG: 50S ribosomal protein L9 [Endomicrobiales bacterium]|nr:50S ribosomal protein L9 [Endomicrobiales bacterium]